MARLRLLALLAITASGCVRLPGCIVALTAKDGGWSITKIEERWNQTAPAQDLIRFANGQVWDNIGMKVEKVAEIPGPDTSKVFAFSALSCVECEPDMLLVLRSTAGGDPIVFSFPGKITLGDMESGESAAAPASEVVAYVGRCLNGDVTEVFVIESRDLKKGKAETRVYRPSNSGIAINELSQLPPATRGVGTCRPIIPVDRVVW